jgi:endonuclease III
VFFCLVYVILSAQTTLEQATAALRAVKRRWRDARALSTARVSDLRRLIRPCGFASQRAPKIIALAKAVAADGGRLEKLRDLEDDAIEEILVNLPGVGFKTARVVAAMSSLGRDRFAIDTHTWRISYRLGWVQRVRLDRKPTLYQANALEDRIPEGIRRQLHACLVALGRDACGPKVTECERCPLVDLCKTGGRGT